MNEQFGIRKILTNHPIVPVCVEDDPARIERVMEKLEASGIRCIEITLRSAGAFEVIQKALEVRKEGFSIGVGTIISSEQVERCATLGVDFMVSPGLTSHLADAFKMAKVPFLPGVMTSSEIIAGLEYGLDTFKLFPFNLAGGEKALQTYGSVFPHVKFCPTGGVNQEIAERILQAQNVIAVGGTWMLK